MNDVVSIVSALVSNVGFPIAAFCAMFWMCNKTMGENTAAINELRSLVQELIDRMENP